MKHSHILPQRWLQQTESYRCTVGPAGIVAIPYSVVYSVVAAMGVAVQHQEGGIWGGGETSHHSQVYGAQPGPVWC